MNDASLAVKYINADQTCYEDVVVDSEAYCGVDFNVDVYIQVFILLCLSIQRFDPLTILLRIFQSFLRKIEDVAKDSLSKPTTGTSCGVVGARLETELFISVALLLVSAVVPIHDHKHQLFQQLEGLLQKKTHP